MRDSILFLIAALLFLLTAVVRFLSGEAILGLLFLAVAVSNGAAAWHYRAQAQGTLSAREDLPKVLGVPVRWHIVVSVVALGLAVGLLVAVIVGDFT